MRLLSRLSVLLACVAFLSSSATAQTKPRPTLKGRKHRVKIDSQPQQAAIYLDSREYGIAGYTPTTLKLPKGGYTIILELPGFAPVSKAITVTRSEAFVFTMEREQRPAVIDLRASQGNDSAVGGQLFVDGAAVGTVPARVEVQAGHHLIEVRKPGFLEYRDSTDVSEGEQRTLVVQLRPEVRKGAILVASDVVGADVYVDGQRRDAAPALIGDLSEGPHTVEVRKDPLPPWKQVVNVVGGQQVKVEARIAAAAPQAGSLRVVSSTPGAEVIVDGEPKGGANAELGGLRVGQHLIEVRAQGYAAQTLDVQIAAGEQRIARVDLKPVAEATGARLRVLTPVPEAEVFLDGASLGKAPAERSDLEPGKHFVVVRKEGYAEWKREVTLDAGGSVTLTADLSASGTVKILSNVAGATVYLDGQTVGQTPLTLDKVPAGDHLLEVKKAGYVDAKQPIRVEGGGQKVLSADLVKLQTGPSAADLSQRYKSMSSFSAVTIEPGRFTADIAGGFFPFGQVRLTVGALRRGMFGLDAGVQARTIGYLTDGGAHAKFQFLKAGPVAMGAAMFIGGGGGPGGRNSVTFELGAPFTLLFGRLVRFTAHPYLQVYSDRLCPPQMAPGEYPVCSMSDTAPAAPFQPRKRFTNVRFLLQAALEIAVHDLATIFFIFEGAPTGEREAYTRQFSAGLLAKDPQIYGRIGVTFKF